MKLDKRTKWSLFGAILLVAVPYFFSYWHLSRRGYAEADNLELEGFYYFPLENTDEWRRKNFLCVRLFTPINLLDRMLGYGRPPASEPLWGLSG